MFAKFANTNVFLELLQRVHHLSCSHTRQYHAAKCASVFLVCQRLELTRLPPSPHLTGKRLAGLELKMFCCSQIGSFSDMYAGHTLGNFFSCKFPVHVCPSHKVHLFSIVFPLGLWSYMGFAMAVSHLLHYSLMSQQYRIHEKNVPASLQTNVRD